MPTSKKKIIFEKIRFFHYPLLQYYLWRGYDISVFDFDYDLKKRPWLRRLIYRGLLRRIYVSCLIRGDGEAIEQTQNIYDRFCDHRLAKEIAQLYQSEEVGLIFKKWLVQEIRRILYIHRYLEEEEKESRAGDILFIPDDYPLYIALLRREASLSFPSFKKIRMLRWILGIRFWQRKWEKGVYLFGMGGYLLIRWLLMVIGSGWHQGKRVPKAFTYGVALHHGFDTAKGFPFLVDENCIQKSEVLFLLYLPVKKDWVLSQEKEGFQFLDVAKETGFHGLWQSRCDFAKLLEVARSLWKAPLYLHSLFPLFQAYLRSLRVYLDYHLIFNRVAIRNYIYCNQESGNQIAFNILIRRQGGETWNYAFSSGGGYLYADDAEDFKQKQFFLWAFLNSDHYVGVSEDQVRYHRLHLQKVHHYHVIGNPYSGMVHEMPQEKPSSQKVIAFFDTSFIDDESCCTTFDHAIYFYQDILRLLEEEKDVFVTIKPAKDDSYFIHPRSQWSSLSKGPVIVRLWDVLRKQDRVLWAGEQGNTPKIIAQSDLVVTHAFSSPTAEALGAGKKAFWYQSQGRQPFLYRDISGLVVHGYPSLKERIGDLLVMEEKDYKTYLNDHIKGRLDPFLDGLALKRFRQLLYEKH